MLWLWLELKMYWLIKTINTPFKLDVALSHIRDALSHIRDDVSSKQEIKQASKQARRQISLLTSYGGAR